MKRLFLISFTLIIVIYSCNKDEDIILTDKNEYRTPSDKPTLIGTWNKSIVARYNSEGDLNTQEFLENIRIEKSSISGSIIQSMFIDTLYSFYFLMYSSYVFENGVLKRYPDSLFDMNMDVYYWNPEDGLFGTFPVYSEIFESSITQRDNSKFIENRIFEDSSSINITYDKINGKSIDLTNEFESFFDNMESENNIMTIKLPFKKAINDNLVEKPVYNTVYNK